MATRQQRPRELTAKDWMPVQPTRITTRKAPEPRDERLRIPRSAQRSRPSPINVAPGEDCLMLPVPCSPGPNEEFCESPRDPEVVDVGGPNTWPRRGRLSQQQCVRRPSPSATSQYSIGQSEISYGILDYYFKDDPLSPSPELPLLSLRIGTPVIDGAMEKFDFELPPRSPSPRPANIKQSTREQIPQDTRSGAERPHNDLLDSSPPLQLTTSQTERKETYSLFPKVKVVTPPRKSTINQAESQLQQSETPRGTITTVPSHQQPDASYRPRKESVSSSVQSRKDSFTSFSGTRRIPMRVLSSSSTPTPKTRSTVSNSTSTESPLQQSRWSDDTVTSPAVLTTPGRRTSFGSLLGGDSTQYLACFFEDDDDDDVGAEAAPLRRKFRWQRSSNVKHEAKARETGRSGRKSFSRRLAKVLLCGCCGDER